MILLVNPPSPFLIDDQVHPPLGITYIASYLRILGHRDVRIYDMNGPMGFTKKMKELPVANVYGITATTPQYGMALRLLKHIRENNPSAKVAIGGPHATALPTECGKDGWDLVVAGEGEVAMTEFVGKSIAKSGDQYVIKFGGDRGSWVTRGTPLKSLGENWRPARDLLYLEDYHYEIDGRPATTLITSRSCPYSCAFCSRQRDKVRYLSADLVIKELEELKYRYGYSAVMFYDDIFVTRLDRLKKICKYMKENDIIFRCFVRANHATDKMFKLLSESGCKEVGFGAESGSDRILKNVDKMTTVAQNTELVRMAHKYGVRVKAFLIAGLPGETEETLAETERWIEEAQPDDFDITVFTPYPGSPIYENPENYDIQFDKENKNYDMLYYKGRMGEYTSPVSTKALTAERIAQRRDEIERKHKKVKQ